LKEVVEPGEEILRVRAHSLGRAAPATRATRPSPARALLLLRLTVSARCVWSALQATKAGVAVGKLRTHETSCVNEELHSAGL
jgi:hypothetical protein